MLRHGAVRRLRSDAKKESASPPQSGNAIERSAEKGPVKLFVRVWPRAPRLSDLVEMDVRVESPARRRDQAAGVRTGRGRLSDSRLQRAAPRGGCGERAPSSTISLSRCTPAST